MLEKRFYVWVDRPCGHREILEGLHVAILPRSRQTLGHCPLMGYDVENRIDLHLNSILSGIQRGNVFDV